MSVSRINESLQIKVNKRDLKEVGHFKYLGNVKTRIAIAKEAFNRKISLLTSKLNFELRKELVRCYVWSIALYGSET